MTNITIYDIEAEKLNRISVQHDTSDAEIIEALFEALEDNDIDLSEYL